MLASLQRVQRHVTTTRKGSGSSAAYIILYAGAPTDYKIVRNDNELEANGLGWGLWFQGAFVAEEGRKKDCMQRCVKFLAGARVPEPIY